MAEEGIEPTGIEADVCADIARRQALGIAKYGQTVADNPSDLRAWLQHIYEEQLDACIYTRRAIAEIDAKYSTAPRELTNAAGMFIGVGHLSEESHL